MTEWTSWAGAVACEATRIERPADEAGLRGVVERATAEGRVVRPVGTGHSSMPLVATDDVIVSLDAIAGIESSDATTGQAWIRAGSKLHDLGGPLREHGLAFQNMGDVDVQSLGGAVGTGTHGTGAALGNISSRVTGMRLITAEAEVLEIAATDADLLRAARVSLGALGVASAIRLALVPAYRLRERVWRAELEDLLDDLPDHIDANRHFEFFWYPSLDRCECKTLNPTDDPAEDPLPEGGGPGERTGWSADIIPSVREMRFHEMEYAVPAENGLGCFAELRTRMRERHPDVVWPVEYRTLAADDAWLSPAHGRPTVTLSIHQDAKLDYRAPFEDLESILLDHGGRPHWGKLHTRGARELREMYPRFDDFCGMRERLDPQGRFLNAHLAALFDAAQSGSTHS
jgi:FAD/FMN-containing dehydrogenase